MTIRRGSPADHDRLLSIWLRSVQATHSFLSAADIDALTPLVREQALVKLELWVIEDGATPIGWMGMAENQIDALFIDPAHHRRGGGRALIAHAQSRYDLLTLDVNEQNPGAIRFYESLGFTPTGRSPLDGQGRPFPLLHLQWKRPALSSH